MAPWSISIHFHMNKWAYFKSVKISIVKIVFIITFIIILTFIITFNTFITLQGVSSQLQHKESTYVWF